MGSDIFFVKYFLNFFVYWRQEEVALELEMTTMFVLCDELLTIREDPQVYMANAEVIHLLWICLITGG